MDTLNYLSYLTPYKTILSLIIIETLNYKNSNEKKDNSKSMQINNIITYLINIITNESESYYEPSLIILYTKFKQLGEIPFYIFNIVLKKIDNINTPDELYDIFIILTNYVSEYSNNLDNSSLFGIYIRKLVISYNSSSFDGLLYIYDLFIKYKNETTKEINIIDNISFNKYITYQIKELETCTSINNYLIKLTKLLNLPSIETKPVYNYLLYLYAIYTSNYTIALDSIHKYFDLTLEHNKMQHAVFAVALFNFRFGLIDSAIAAIYECIPIAQTKQDTNCLLHALLLLVRISIIKGQTSEAETVCKRCLELVDIELKKENSSSGNQLAVETALVLAKNSLEYSDQNIRNQSEYFLKAVDSFFNMNEKSQNNLSSFRAVSWDLLGQRYLVSLYLDLSKEQSKDFTLLANVESNKGLSRTDFEKLLKTMYGGITLNKQFTQQLSKNTQSILSNVFKQSDFIELKLSSDTSSESPVYDFHSNFNRSFICFERAFEMCDQKSLLYYLNLMQTYCSSNADNHNIYFQAHYSQAKYHYFLSEYSASLLVLAKLSDHISNFESSLSLPIFLLKSQIHRDCNDFGMAADSLLVGLSIADSHNFESWQATLCIELSHVHLALGNNDSAIILLDRWSPYIIRNGNLVTIRSFYLAKISYLMKLLDDDKLNKKTIINLIDILKKTQKVNSKLFNIKIELNICKSLAIMYNKLNDFEERDYYAQNYHNGIKLLHKAVYV